MKQFLTRRKRLGAPEYHVEKICSQVTARNCLTLHTVLTPHVSLPQGRSLFVNKALAGLFGKTVPEMNVYWSCLKQDWHLATNLEAIESNRTLHFPEQEFTDTEGRTRCFRVTKTPFRTADTDAPVSRASGTPRLCVVMSDFDLVRQALLKTSKTVVQPVGLTETPLKLVGAVIPY